MPKRILLFSLIISLLALTTSEVQLNSNTLYIKKQQKKREEKKR